MKHQTYIIAEMSANHAGDLDIAKQIVHRAKWAGADCIKVQTYTADTLTLDSEGPYFKIKEGRWSGYRLYDLYQEAAMPWSWQSILKQEAEKIGLDFLSTAYDETAADFLEGLGVAAYKIASFEIVDLPLIAHVAKKNKPILISAGMATLEEIEEAISVIEEHNDQEITLLKCASAYPAHYEDMDLETILDLKKRFPNCRIGFSDHSTDALSTVIAVSLGAQVVEKHFCLSKDIVTADSGFSLSPEAFRDMVMQIRNTEKALGKVCYGVKAGEEKSMVFRKSLFFCKSISKGELITPEHLRIIRPGYGAKPKYLQAILGKKILRDKEAGEPLMLSEVEK